MADISESDRQTALSTDWQPLRVDMWHSAAPTHAVEGIRAALVIGRQYPDVALLVLSQYVEESYATDLLSAVTSSRC